MRQFEGNEFEGNELFMHIHIRVSITSVMITAFSHKTLKGFLAHQTVLVTFSRLMLLFVTLVL